MLTTESSMPRQTLPRQGPDRADARPCAEERSSGRGAAVACARQQLHASCDLADDSVPLGMRQFEAPYGPVEKTIARIWSALLGIEKIGRDDHFFELGGHSALAVQAVYQLRREMQVNVTMRDLLLAPELQRFALNVGARSRSARAPLASSAPVLESRSPGWIKRNRDGYQAK